MARRSVLFSPGDRPEMLRKAPTSGADVVAFDLEDAVAPGRKAAARETVAEVLGDPDFDPDCEVCVRVNPPPVAREDLDVVLGDDRRPDGLIVPKAASSDDVADVADAAAERGAELPVVALIESARGVLAAPEIAAAEPTDALAFGAEDLAADLGAARTEEGTEVLYARERVVVAARAAGVDAVDTVYTDVDDEAGLRAATEFALQLGYDGKMAIHPAQVDPIHAALTPDDDRIEWARRVLAASEDAGDRDRGVFEVDGEMIDAPLVAQAERVLERAGESAAGSRRSDDRS